jgi:hypothetical protein
MSAALGAVPRTAPLPEPPEPDEFDFWLALREADEFDFRLALREADEFDFRLALRELDEFDLPPVFLR